MQKDVRDLQLWQSGSLILEVVLAFSIITLAMSTIIIVFFSNQSMAIDLQTSREAAYRAGELIENARAVSRQDFNALVSTATLNDDIYQKSLEVQTVNAYTKTVTGNVVWKTEAGRLQNIRLTTLLTNPFLTSTCNSTLVGDWKNPQIISYEFGKDLLVPPDNSNEFPISDVEAFGNKLYITTSNTSSNHLPDFFIFDISDTGIKPQFLFGIDNAPTISKGLNAVAVSGHYAYVANAYTGSVAVCATAANCAQLQIIDLDNLSSPPINLKLPSTTSSGNLTSGKTIFYTRGYVYIGMTKASGSGSEFYIIDVGGGGSGSPTSPITLGSYQTKVGINKIYVKDSYAYLAIPDGGIDDENVTVLDVSDPANPHRVAGYAPSGGSNGESITVANGKIYLGRTFGTNEFYVLSAPNAGLVASKDIGISNSTSINDLIVRDSLTFLVTSAQFQIWNVGSLPSITQWATPLNLPGNSGRTIGCTGNSIYVGSLPANNKGYISTIKPGP